MTSTATWMKALAAWRQAVGALAMLLAVASQAQAQTQAGAPGHPALLRALNTLRQQGCDGGGAPAAALREDPRLSYAAERIADGRKLDEALKSAGYRYVRAVQITLRGSGAVAALARGAVGSSCGALMQGDLAEAGFHQHGTQVSMVLAVPFSPPDAAQAGAVLARLLTLVNEARAQPRRCGSEAFAAAGPLRLNSTLHGVAAAYAADMARHSYISHTGRDGSQVGDRVNQAGYHWRNVGENLAAGQMTAEITVQNWIDSPGHCANLMRPTYTEMGAAFAVNNSSAMGIYWVQVLGTAR